MLKASAALYRVFPASINRITFSLVSSSYCILSKLYRVGALFSTDVLIVGDLYCAKLNISTNHDILFKQILPPRGSYFAVTILNQVKSAFIDLCVL